MTGSKRYRERRYKHLRPEPLMWPVMNDDDWDQVQRMTEWEGRRYIAHREGRHVIPQRDCPLCRV